MTNKRVSDALRERIIEPPSSDKTAVAAAKEINLLMAIASNTRTMPPTMGELTEIVSKHYAPKLVAAEKMEKALRECSAKIEKVAAWLEKLALADDEQAKDTRFITLSDACKADAKNRRATAKDIRTASTSARAALAAWKASQ